MYYILYGFLYLISLLPFRVLYFFSDGLYGLVYYIIGYRKKVVLNNLKIAFPEKTEKERIRIAKDFYHNLMDYVVETIKLISASEKEIFKRCSSEFDINDIQKLGKSIQAHWSHQFNAEYANWFYAKHSMLPSVGMYVHVSFKPLDKILLDIRTRYGTIMVEAGDFRNKMNEIYKKPYILGWAADQNPAKPQQSYWLNFFSKPAPFIKIPEKSAVINKTAVIFGRSRKVKRGYYSFEYKFITGNAAELPPGEITRLYRDYLEETIRIDPANYLWSHRRWKHPYKEEYKNSWIDKD